MASPGNLLKVLGIALIIAGAVAYLALGGADENPAAILAALIMVAGILINFRGRRLAAKATAREPTLRSAITGSHVLYLRSFTTDASSTIKILQSGLSTEEEQLAAVLRPFGELVAIGQPGEPLPLPGAERVYATDNEWKDRILDLMLTSRLVLIWVGAGKGLRWELAQACRRLPPDRLVLLILRTSSADYANLATALKAETGLTLPAIRQASMMSAVVDYRENPTTLQPGFIRFTKGWDPHFLPLPRNLIRLGYNDFVASFNDALRPVFEAHGIEWHPLSRFSARKA